ncbi:sulfotransferase domain-containing protein [Sorangium sp. So ce1335]|uniref:sulfotransferase domain-containing protein n=1 Tax=Sorangium sp. So ce1335 TaxID=3133335 RepID=UPI003F645D20
MIEQQSPPAAAPRKRPTNAEEFRALSAERSPFVVPPFQPRPTDILIATFPKCGTTWTQQIVHGLRTRGSMDFEEISFVIPFIEVSPLLGMDLEAPQPAEPRAYKTHLPWTQVPKGGRYIYVMRDPADTLVSFYHFMSGMLFEPGTVDIETFSAEAFFKDAPFGGYWEHLRSWWEQRRRDDVLFLCFEDMKRDHAAAVRRIAAFMGVSDEQAIAVATRQSTFEFMRAHESQFDDHPTTAAISRVMGMPPARTTKVRAGRVGDGAGLPASVRAALDDAWKRCLEAPLGVRSYEELRARLASEA